MQNDPKFYDHRSIKSDLLLNATLILDFTATANIIIIGNTNVNNKFKGGK